MEEVNVALQAGKKWRGREKERERERNYTKIQSIIF
jgi:hypothetical protein